MNVRRKCINKYINRLTVNQNPIYRQIIIITNKGNCIKRSNE